MSDIVLKVCTRCKQEKPLTDFYLNRPADNYYAPRCKACLSEITKEKRASKRPPVAPVADGYKRCPTCGENYPATKEYFFSNKSKPDGFAVYCKPCWKQSEQNRQAKRPILPPPETLKCIKCGMEKPATTEYFSAAQNMSHGLQSMCRECRNAGKRSLYHTNDERRARILQQQREYYKLTKEHRCAYARQWQRTHRAHINARARVYRKREYVKEQRRAEVRNRYARKKQAPGKFTKQDVLIQLKRQKYRCYWCKANLKKEKRTYHIDHVVPLSRGGTNWPDNLVIACHTCNESRNNRLPHEWPKGGRLL